MNNELFDALELLQKEKRISMDKAIEMIRASISAGIKAVYGEVEDFDVTVDFEKRKFGVVIFYNVVETVEDPEKEMTLAQAREHSKRAKLGDRVKIKVDPKKFGRISAQNAKNTMRQNIRKEEREQAFQEFQSQKGEITTGLVVAVDTDRGGVTLEIGKNQAILPPKEQVEGERLRPGERVKVYVVDVKENEKYPRLLISRTHAGLVKRLFEIEVPEIADGTIEIKAVAREAGSRSKLAVTSVDENVDAVGSCIGNKGTRIAKIIDELGGEKIDVVNYSDDVKTFIANALAPAQVVSVEITDEESKTCLVRVPDNQQSLAIGNKGQNVRLAARLTGWKIDIRPESGFYGENV